MYIILHDRDGHTHIISEVLMFDLANPVHAEAFREHLATRLAISIDRKVRAARVVNAICDQLNQWFKYDE